jgi:hypothetical protein
MRMIRFQARPAAGRSPSAWRAAVLGVALLCGVVVALAGVPAPAAENLSIEDFYGTYRGHWKGDEDQNLAKRDVEVEIRKAGKGFLLEWKTVIHKADGGKKTSEQSVEFRRTDRPNIYISAVKKDMFGNKKPMDPIKGEPLLWSVLSRDTLSTYSMTIGEAGNVEMQMYERTIVDEGMELRFYRFTNGWISRALNVLLERVSK